MVSYYNPMAVYRQQGPVGPASGQFHNSGNTAAGWYGGYHHGAQMPTPQQYFNTAMQDGESQQMSWHHAHHSVFNHEFFDYNNYLQQQQQQQHHQQQQQQQLQLQQQQQLQLQQQQQQQLQQQQQQQLQIPQPASETQMTSPPVSSSELSSPGAAGGTVTPPNQIRPGSVRSPYDWINKPSYQSQPNPEIGTLSSAPLLLDFSPQDPSGKTRTKDKYRVVYTDHQRLELEKEFHFSRYITIRRKSELAANLGLSERQVKIWFQNRRAKERKQVKKRDELNSKDILNPASVAAAAMQLHQQGLLHHHHHQQQQQQQQAAVAASVAAAAAAAAQQTQIGGGHTSVVPLPGPLM